MWTGNRRFGCLTGVALPVDVKFAASQLPESLTVVWKHPLCDQTNYISGFAVAYRKVMDNNCDSTAGGKSCCDVHMTVLLEVSHAVMYTTRACP